MRAALLLGLPWLVAGSMIACSNDRADTFRHTAARINPTLASMQPAARTVLHTSGSGDSDTAAVAKACLAPIPKMSELMPVGFDDQDLTGRTFSGDPVSAWASEVGYLPSRNPCSHWERSHLNAELCRDDCVHAWTNLVHAVDRLSDAAQREGVFIVRLSL